MQNGTFTILPNVPGKGQGRDGEIPSMVYSKRKNNIKYILQDVNGFLIGLLNFLYSRCVLIYTVKNAEKGGERNESEQHNE